MLLTVDQARTKWCPESIRCGSIATTSYNRYGDTRESGLGHDRLIPEQCICLASECMAWRWAEPLNKGDDLLGYCGEAGCPRELENAMVLKAIKEILEIVLKYQQKPGDMPDIALCESCSIEYCKGKGGKPVYMCSTYSRKQ